MGVARGLQSVVILVFRTQLRMLLIVQTAIDINHRAPILQTPSNPVKNLSHGINNSTSNPPLTIYFLSDRV